MGKVSVENEGEKEWKGGEQRDKKKRETEGKW